MPTYIESNFEEIFNTYYSPVCYFLNLYTKDEAAIEDITQDVFCTLWANKDSLKIDNIKSYLYTLARNKALNHLRDIKLHEKLLSAWMSEEKELIDSLDCVDNIEFEKNITQAIDNLSPKCKRVFKLSRYEKLTYKEIALLEEISEKMVEKHISTALKKIKDYVLRTMHLFIL